MKWQQANVTETGAVLPANWLFLHYYEALNVLFRIENALRILVYIVLKNDKRDRWTDISLSSDEAADTTIGALAKKRIAQHQTFGYLGYPIEAPMMHLTSGELVRLLTSDTHWPLFKEFFRAAREVVTLKLREIGDVRNALAHFRPLSEDDVEAVKQNAKQVLSSVETALESMVACDQRVPTNTTDPWYEYLRSMGTDLCSLEFTQSTDNRWIRATLRFGARIVTQIGDGRSWLRFNVLNIETPSVLLKYDSLRRLTTYVTEEIPYVIMPEDCKPQFDKRIHFTFSRSTLVSEHAAVTESFKRLFADVDIEAELVAEDNLAKGQVVHLAAVFAARRRKGDDSHWWELNRRECSLRSKAAIHRSIGA